jgi:hypothetical protein
MGLGRHWCRRCGRKHCWVGVGGIVERRSPPIASPAAVGVRLFVVAVRSLRRWRRTLTPPHDDGAEGWGAAPAPFSKLSLQSRPKAGQALLPPGAVYPARSHGLSVHRRISTPSAARMSYSRCVSRLANRLDRTDRDETRGRVHWVTLALGVLGRGHAATRLGMGSAVRVCVGDRRNWA